MCAILNVKCNICKITFRVFFGISMREKFPAQKIEYTGGSRLLIVQLQREEKRKVSKTEKHYRNIGQ